MQVNKQKSKIAKSEKSDINQQHIDICVITVVSMCHITLQLYMNCNFFILQIFE